jgi:hypothetical protein
VTASQPGSPEYAGAADVARTYSVDFQLLSADWMRASTTLSYSAAHTVELKFVVRSTAPLDARIPGASLSFSVTGNGCGEDNGTNPPRISLSGSSPREVTTTWTLPDPGNGSLVCTVQPQPDVDVSSNYSHTPTARTYTINP